MRQPDSNPAPAEILDGKGAAHYRCCSCLIFVMLAQLFDGSAALAQDGGEGYYEKREFRGEFSGGDLNISSYAFRDLNRNGVFDLGDRAMAEIAFRMRRPDGSRLVRRSNVAGFANFEMSVLDREKDVTDPGEYRFEAQVPAGWTLTTDNAEQVRSFHLLPGAPADLVTGEIAQPVGFAPDLTIRGRILLPAPGDSSPRLTARSPSGEAIEVEVDGEGEYEIAAEPGSWTLELAAPDAGGVATRMVEVGQTPVHVSAMDPAASEPDGAPAPRIVGFDDLMQTEAVAEVPSGYGGLGWRNWVAAHNLAYGGEGYVNGTVSGEYIVYNSSGHPVEIFADAPFDFRGGYFSVAWIRAEGERLQITGWRGDEVAYEDEIELSSLGPVYFAADYRGLTRLQFSTARYWQFVGDDFSFGLAR